MNVWNAIDGNKKSNLTILFAAGLLFWISITLLLPTLPAYVQDMGATTQQVGIVMGCFAIGLLCSRTWLGQVADRRSRKIVILIGTVVAGSAPIGYLLVHSIMGLAAMRAFHGISIAAFTVGYSALVVDFSPKELRGTLIGYMNLAVPIGMSIGPALGGYLQGIEIFTGGTGYEVLFLVSSLSGLMALFLSSQIKEFSPKNKYEIAESDNDLVQRDFWQLTKDPALMIPTMILLTVGLVFGTLVAFLPLYVRELGISFNVGLYYTVTAIASFTIRLFAGKASDRYGRGLFISSSLICYFISMILLAQAETPLILILSAVAEGTGAGILIPLILALISDRSYANERGKVFALCLGGFDVGIALAGPVLGFVTLQLDYRGIFMLAAFLALIALSIFTLKSGKTMQQSIRFATGKAQDAYILGN